jgi:predicted transcriptional regulator
VNLKDWRNLHDVSISTLSERIGKTRQTIYNYESGDTSPPLSVVSLISEITDGDVSAHDWYRGWYDKYEVSKTDGSELDTRADYFVLRLDTDPAARAAALAYASVCQDRKLAAYLRARVVSYEQVRAEAS